MELLHGIATIAGFHITRESMENCSSGTTSLQSRTYYIERKKNDY